MICPFSIPDPPAEVVLATPPVSPSGLLSIELVSNSEPIGSFQFTVTNSQGNVKSKSAQV